MRNGIEKCIMLFIAADLTDQKDHIQNKAGDDRNKKDDAEDHQSDFAQIEQDPAHVQRYGQSYQADPEDKKEYGCFSPAHYHLKM